MTTTDHDADVTDCNGHHKAVVIDRFSRIPGVRRAVPGDCFCLDCGRPISAFWNNGKPQEVQANEQQ